MQALTLGVALGVSALFVLLAWNAHGAMSALRANLAIEAFFDPDVSSQQALEVLNQKIRSLPGVHRTVFISKEQALDDYAKMSGENIERVLGVNPLPASVKIYLAEPTSQVATQLESLVRSVTGVQEVKSDAPLIAAMESRSLSLDRIAELLCSLLLVAAFCYALMASRHGFALRRETTRMLARMGATRFTITAPVVLYNVLAGLIGGAVGMGILLLVHAEILAAMSHVFAVTLTTQDETMACGMLMAFGLAISALAAILNAMRTSVST